MKRTVICAIGLAGLLTVHSGNLIHANDLKQQGLFNSLYSQEAVVDLNSTSDLVAAMVDKSDEERFTMANDYIQANAIATKRYLNLLGALKVLGMSAKYTDQLTALYVGKREGKFTMDTLYRLLDTLSPRAFIIDSEKENYAAQIVSVHLQNRSITFEAFKTLVRRALRRNEIASLQLDSQVLLTYVKFQGGKLDQKQFDQIYSMTDRTHMGVQSKAILTEEYIKKNADRLIDPEFRSWVVKKRNILPVGQGVYSVQSLSAESLDRLLYCEYKYFGNLFFGINSVVETIQEGLQDTEWKRVSELFIERNKHRLGKSKSEYLRSVFP